VERKRLGGVKFWRKKSNDLKNSRYRKRRRIGGGVREATENPRTLGLWKGGGKRFRKTSILGGGLEQLLYGRLGAKPPAKRGG